MIQLWVVPVPHLEKHSKALYGTDEKIVVEVKCMARSHCKRKWQIGNWNTVDAFVTALHHISCLAFQTLFLVTTLQAAATKTAIAYIYVTLPIKIAFTMIIVYDLHKLCYLYLELKFREIKVLASNFVLYIFRAK